VKLKEVKEILKPYTEEEIRKVVEIIFKDYNPPEIPEWLIPQFQKELEKRFKDKPRYINVRNAHMHINTFPDKNVS
jgi:hypothetical protein